MELKDVFGEIESDGANLVHGRLLEWALTPPLWHAEAVGGRPHHQERKHDEPRHDERAVSDAVHSSDARPDRRPEDHKVERGREHRGHDALQQRPPRAGHFEQVDGPDRQNVHARSLSSPTKISSSELWLVCRSLNRMPAWARSARSAVMPVRSAWVS